MALITIMTTAVQSLSITLHLLLQTSLVYVAMLAVAGEGHYSSLECGLCLLSLDWYLSDGSCCQGNQQAILCCGRVLQVCARVSSHAVGREEP